jgi:hypothetical protein
MCSQVTGLGLAKPARDKGRPERVPVPVPVAPKSSEVSVAPHAAASSLVPSAESSTPLARRSLPRVSTASSTQAWLYRTTEACSRRDNVATSRSTRAAAAGETVAPEWVAILIFLIAYSRPSRRFTASATRPNAPRPS